jgi:hypothetical protein
MPARCPLLNRLADLTHFVPLAVFQISPTADRPAAGFPVAAQEVALVQETDVPASTGADRIRDHVAPLSTVR